MPHKKTRRGLPYRRKREGRTDYRKRLGALKSGATRLVIRKSLKHVMLQLINYQQDGDKILLTVSTKDLTKHYGWKGASRNTPAAYLAGYLLAKKAAKVNVSEAVVDLGLQKAIKGNILFAAVKGAIDGGLTVPHDAKVFPSEERIKGQHLKSSPFTEVKKAIELKVK